MRKTTRLGISHCRLLVLVLLQLLMALVVVATAEKEWSGKVLFYTTHKMGYVLTYRFGNKQIGNWRMSAVKPNFRSGKAVVVLREMFDATVSGYLYHKTGHECWLNQYGKPNNEKKARTNNSMRRKNWTSTVTQAPVPDEIYDFPKYDLCQALNATNETIGMGIYLEFARKHYYKKIGRVNKNPESPALYVCMDEMKNYPNQTEQRIRDFYEGSNTERYNPDNFYQQDHASRRLLNNVTDGHGTDHDPVLRKRLYDIARELDCKYFGCETQLWNEGVKCRSSIYPNGDYGGMNSTDFEEETAEEGDYDIRKSTGFEEEMMQFGQQTVQLLGGFVALVLGIGYTPRIAKHFSERVLNFLSFRIFAAVVF